MQVSKTQLEKAYKLTELENLCHAIHIHQETALLHTGNNSSWAAPHRPSILLAKARTTTLPLVYHSFTRQTEARCTLDCPRPKVRSRLRAHVVLNEDTL